MRAGHFYTVQQDSINSPSLSTFHLIISLPEQLFDPKSDKATNFAALRL
jgi:hypothetical protein